MNFLKASAVSSLLCAIGSMGMGLMLGYIPTHIDIPENERTLPDWMVFVLAFIAAYIGIVFLTYVFTRVAFTLKILSRRFLIWCAVVTSILFGLVAGYSPPLFSFIGIMSVSLGFGHALLVLLPTILLWWMVAHNKANAADAQKRRG